jgi:hypothetical protein
MNSLDRAWPGNAEDGVEYMKQSLDDTSTQPNGRSARRRPRSPSVSPSHRQARDEGAKAHTAVGWFAYKPEGPILCSATHASSCARWRPCAAHAVGVSLPGGPGTRGIRQPMQLPPPSAVARATTCRSRTRPRRAVFAPFQATRPAAAARQAEERRRPEPPDAESRRSGRSTPCR